MSLVGTRYRKIRGRPKLNKTDPNTKVMRVSDGLWELLQSEKREHETLCETALRLLRHRGKKVIDLTRELEDVINELDKYKKFAYHHHHHHHHQQQQQHKVIER